MKVHVISSLLTAIGCLFLTYPSLHAQVPQLINYQGRVAVGGVNFTGTGQFKFALVDAGTNVSTPATATAVVTSGFVTSVNVAPGGSGSGYPSRPAVSFTGGGGSGATATANLTGGVVTSITVNSAGIGYSSAPTVVIAPPPPTFTATLWSNDGTSAVGGAPTAAVPLQVAGGLYSVLLGDATLPNMTVIPNTVFNTAGVRLRIWFNDGPNGFQLLTPDQQIAAVGYAMMAANVRDGAITSAKIAAGAVGSTQIATGAVGSTQIATGSVSTAKIATGAVGAAQIAAGAIGTTQLGAGAVTSANIAAGSVAFTDLAKPPQSGTVSGSSLDLEFGQATFNVTFPEAFAATPVVAVSLASAVTSLPNATVRVTSTSSTGFSGRVELSSSTIISPDNTGSVGQYTSLAVVGGRAAISYYDASDRSLRYVRSNSSTDWSTPVAVDDTFNNAGLYTSLAVVSGNPAISYYDATDSVLKYVRAADNVGSAWSTPPMIVDSSAAVGEYTSLVVVSGNPAICYFDNTNNQLKYVRATNATGTAWGSPVIVDTAGSVGEFASMAVVSGNPAISYYDATNTSLKYVRANDANGTTPWGPPVTVDNISGDCGRFTSLAVVSGNPAISYYHSTEATLKYVRAANATGTSWNPPIEPTGGLPGTYTSLAVVDGNPAISYYYPFDNQLRYVRATDASGIAWGTHIILDRAGAVGEYTSLRNIFPASPAISYYDASSGDLKFIIQVNLSNFTINWIALPP